MGRKGITAKQYGSPMQILGVVEPKISLPIMVAQSVGVADAATGKKIVKAGTPVYGDLTARDTAFVAASESNATGIILHDVDVTSGESEASLLIFGVVNLDRIDTKTQALLTSTIKGAMHGIYFIKD